MTINDFWNLIEKCKDAECPELVLADLLDALSVEEMVIFDYYFRCLESCAYREDIWCAAYLLNGECGDESDDSDFINFLRGLISKGRSVYEMTLKNPDSLQALWGQGEIENESFGWVARRAYAKKMGVSATDAMGVMFRYDDGRKFDLYINGELYVAPEVERWDFDDEAENRKRLPGLSRLFYDGRDQASPAFGPQHAKREDV